MQSVEYSPLIRGLVRAAVRPAGPLLPMCRNASLLVVPDISGYIGADTIGCVLSTGLYESEETILLVDIGTNGEMVLGGKDRMIACAAAAGPALEGASIRFGMRGAAGAVDHVWLELTQELAERIAFLELAQLPAFRRTFARNMGFSSEV